MAPSKGESMSSNSDVRDKPSSVVKQVKGSRAPGLPTTGPSFTLNSIPARTTAEKRRVSRRFQGLRSEAFGLLHMDASRRV